MKVRVGINGFGRMGRLALRAAWNSDILEIGHINEVQGGAETAAHLLEFDTVHGRWQKDISVEGDVIIIDGQRITFSECVQPGEVSWDDRDIGLTLECSGKFRTRELLTPYHLKGVKKVIVAAPVKDGALNIVMGCNDELYDPSKHDIVTAASCTTNCLGPIVKVIHENLGIVHGSITTIHDATNTQVIVDAPHKDLRRARSALNSLIPTTTGSAKAITMIYPELAGRLNGLAVRVPLLNASLVDCVFEVKSRTSPEEVNGLFRNASKTDLKGILGFEDKPLVSADYTNDPRSGIVDGPATMVVNDTQVKILAWYDNEIGYVNRMVELAEKVARSIQ